MKHTAPTEIVQPHRHATKHTNHGRTFLNLYGLWVILLGYLAVTAGYSVITPLFEAPDEHWHYFTAEYIAGTRRLPAVAADDYDEWLSQEAAQPPLYYILGALLIAPIDTAGARQQVWLNPFAQIGNAAALTNINLAVHGPWEAWPWRGYALAAHMLRLFSTLLGLGTLLCIYGSGRLLWPNTPHPALLATAVIAFLPQFNFLHAAVTNDALVIFLCSAAIYQLLVINNSLSATGSRLTPHASRITQLPITNNQLLLLGVTIGLAALAKNAGILLLLYSAGFLGVLAWRYGRWELLWKTAVTVILPALLIAGWLWWRNWTLYGDPLATAPFIRIAGGDRGYTLWQVLAESSSLWLSFFAVFGWFNLRAPAWVYWAWSGVVVVAAVGAIAKVAEGQRGRGAEEKSPPPLRSSAPPLHLLHRWLLPLLLTAWPLAVYAGLVAFMLRTEAAQGRLLFPAIVPLALGAGCGLARWGRAAWLAPAAALATTLVSLLLVIRPAYAPPPILDALPPTAVSLNAGMGNGLTLVGAEMETETAVPGDLVWLTLYWRAAAPPAEAPEVKLELLGQDVTDPIAELHSYHGRGLYPANLWPPGALIADRFAVRLHSERVTAVPVLARAFVRLVDEADPRPGVEVGRVKVSPSRWPPLSENVLAQIGDGVQLTAVAVSPTTAQPGDTILIDVTWQVITAPGRDLSTLIHLAQPGKPPLATGDGPPRGGSYPTRAWAPGEVIHDRYTLTVPADLAPGSYPLWTGMYDPQTVTNLPIMANGELLPDGRFPIGTVTVGE